MEPIHLPHDDEIRSTYQQGKEQTMREDLYQIADELRAIANAGARWTENGYDKENYDKVLKASARLVAVMENCSEDGIYQQYMDNLAHLSPILCVEAAVFRNGKILLIRRSDDRTWALPGGMLEVGESPAQGVERELWEEAGVHGKAVRLLGLFDSRLWPSKSRMQLCIAQFMVQTDVDPHLPVPTKNSLSSHTETLDVDFFAEDHLPEMHIGHDRRVPMAFRLSRQELDAPFFDK
jgi:ADP-ribose pyrophosphatase YjhB (NUDIX family)